MSTRILLEGRKFRVEAVDVPDREGKTRTREVVRHPGAVVILPLLSDGRIVLIRNQRFAVNATLYEIPAGTREPGESDELGARRELEEETGYRAGKLAPLVRFFASPGFCDEEMIGFVATDLEVTAQRLDATEHIDVEAVDVATFREMLRDGRIVDGKTLACGLYWLAFVASGTKDA
jgi:ADP-ribose pyrophosphatase